ncbi:MAG: LysR family transcriptional regulator [Acutalibacteraceae bacterium]
MDINFDLYHVFCEVAREKSLSAAAKKLYVSQSAVSQSIKQLEKSLDAKLFDRKSRGVELTPEGKLLFEYADNAYTLLENAMTKFSEMKDLKFGNIKIGASDTVCALLLTNVLKEFHAKYPDINIQLINNTTGQLLSQLKLGEIDMAFVALPIEENEGLFIKKIVDINDCFVVSGKYSSLARRTINLKELENYPVLMLDKKSSSRLFLDKFLNKKGINIKPCVELGSIDLLTKFAEIGIGVSAVIEQYVSEKLVSGELEKLQLSEPIPKRAIGLVTLENVSLSPSSKKLIDLMFK